MMTVTVEDVEKYSSTGWANGLTDATKEAMLEQAKSLMDHQFSKRIATLPNFKGDRDKGLKLLASHLFEIAEGGEAQSENSEGGSVTYNTVTGDPVDSLQETRYGRLFRDQYLFDEQGISVVRSR